MPSTNDKRRSLGNAKAHFAECVRAAERGQATVLTRHGRPVARLVPLEDGGGMGDRYEAGEVGEPVSDYEKRAAPIVSSREARRAAFQRLLEQEIWPQIPEEMIGKAPSKAEREEILGLSEKDS